MALQPLCSQAKRIVFPLTVLLYFARSRACVARSVGRARTTHAGTLAVQAQENVLNELSSLALGTKTLLRRHCNYNLNIQFCKMTTQNTTSDTIFIRNLSFDSEEDSLKAFFEENFGETAYCLICRDKETGESKGTAFVKFKEADKSTQCLREFKDRDLMTKFNFDGRNLIVLPAVSRDEVQEIKQANGKKKDKRNLALIKEGFIHPSSDEAKDMSKNDLEKRRALNARAKEKLANLHNFVSDVRLCIHNLPPSVDDEKLHKIFMNSLKDVRPKIMECRVMRMVDDLRLKVETVETIMVLVFLFLSNFTPT